MTAHAPLVTAALAALLATPAARADTPVERFVAACLVRGTPAECGCLGPELARRADPALRDFTLEYLTGMVDLGNQGLEGDAPEAGALLDRLTAAYALHPPVQQALFAAMGAMQAAAEACSGAAGAP